MIRSEVVLVAVTLLLLGGLLRLRLGRRRPRREPLAELGERRAAARDAVEEARAAAQRRTRGARPLSPLDDDQRRRRHVAEERGRDRRVKARRPRVAMRQRVTTGRVV